MLLIFQLGRLDVLPADDFGVRTGYRVAYKKREMPKPKELLAFGEKWKPASHDGGLVFVVRGGRGEGREEKEVTPRRTCANKFLWAEFPKTFET